MDRNNLVIVFTNKEDVKFNMDTDKREGKILKLENITMEPLNIEVVLFRAWEHIGKEKSRQIKTTFHSN